MADTATQTQQTVTTAPVQPSPAGGQTDGFRPALDGAAALVGESLRFGGATVRAASDVISGGAGPALVLLAAGFLAAGWMRRRR